MRKRVSAPTPTPATVTADAPVPPGYRVLAIGGGWLPVREKRPGVYVELADETGQRGPYPTQAQALAVIKANPGWRKRQAEMKRAKAAQAQAVEAAAQVSKGGERR